MISALCVAEAGLAALRPEPSPSEACCSPALPSRLVPPPLCQSSPRRTSREGQDAFPCGCNAARRRPVPDAPELFSAGGVCMVSPGWENAMQTVARSHKNLKSKQGIIYVAGQGNRASSAAAAPLRARADRRAGQRRRLCGRHPGGDRRPPGRISRAISTPAPGSTRCFTASGRAPTSRSKASEESADGARKAHERLRALSPLTPPSAAADDAGELHDARDRAKFSAARRKK